MKKKVINLFKDNTVVQNQGVKYSELFENFLTPFVNDFRDVEFYEDIIEFGISAWNFGNMKSILPEDESDSYLKVANENIADVAVLQRMVNYKVLNFKQYGNFIVDYDLEEVEENPILTVVTQEEEGFLANMLDKIGNEESIEEFQENFINRNAIVLKPLKPFIDWVNKLYPEEEHFQTNQVSTYLVDEEIENLEVWITKKFDKFFMFELEGWSTDKKVWPQKRTNKMFKEWFRVEVSMLVFDMEKSPVSKSD
ncbi:hypothetical protein [Flavobacterium tegetincola]|uniref:hypothetical protein n=1 Tax=Flavobacterium tegetincola TaxID=150172 RepID=UPI00040F1235|nr:hypothetical protein [Flavobacterium tegetincola]